MLLSGMNYPPQNLTIATTGASGAIFLRQLLLSVVRHERVQTVNFIASDSALRVMAEELDIQGRSNLDDRILGTSTGEPAENLRGRTSPKIQPQETQSQKI